MIRHLCANCQVELRPAEQLDDKQEQISHGLCPACMAKVMSRLGQSLKEYLNEFSEPVLVLDKYSLVITTNNAGERVLGKNVPELTGYLGGDVLGCLHAKEPGGCGATLHCLSCVIRNTVKDTYQTGCEHQNVPACMDIDTISGPRKKSYNISTEKVDDLVLLKLEKCA